MPKLLNKFIKKNMLVTEELLKVGDHRIQVFHVTIL